MGAAGLQLLVYSNSFQIRQILARNQHFSWNNNLLLLRLLLRESKFQKNINFRIGNVASKQKETYFASGKTLQHIERLDH